MLLITSVCFPTSESGGGNNRREILKLLYLQFLKKENLKKNMQGGSGEEPDYCVRLCYSLSAPGRQTRQ